MAKTKGSMDFSEGKNPPPVGKKYLLGIGINAYAHCPQLHNAVRDVEDFAALMHEKFGFDPEPPYTQMLRNE